ncbi:hypothetical protein [Pukyongiella litopenaei]|uniref:Uncharacterized protein n=1 Tax=Pukyongiella litopenaei TaxID=2605946 RepID=A0A2S0ML35_9RHOB|nr:hypothetical protein [Pukyongiella litopenaei]AVO36594.1 hypothetical protein C6Y53_02015 [Pukyongiella litopenaei]
MRSFSTAITNYLATGQVVVRQLIYFWARDHDTNAAETIGFWNDAIDGTVTIDGSPRTYIGRGAFQGTEPIIASPGLDVRTLQAAVAVPSSAVEDMVKGYNTRFAPVEVHRVFLNPETRAAVGSPIRDFRGFVEGIDWPDGSETSAAWATIRMVSETRILTRKLAGRKSHQTFREWGGDFFRRYGDVSGSVPVYWGEQRMDSPSDPKPKGPKKVTQEESPMFNSR